MKDGSDDDNSNVVPTSRDADSTVVSTNGGMAASHQRRMQVMGATLAALGAQVVASSALASSSSPSGHDGHPLVGNTTLANALLGITLDRNSASGSPNNVISPRINSTVSPQGNGKSDSSAHNNNNNQNRDKVFMCPICNRCFGYKHVLQNHERTHTGEKPFECKQCQKRFTRDHHLKTHMRLHTGEKPYQCSHCDRKFVQVANLRRHLRVHTGERPYACNLCSSRFSDSNQLKAHLLIHEGKKPFECAECHGRFRRRHHLVHHKCPKDEANIGKPRRGRRPKAYDQMPTTIPLLSPVLQERLSAPITDLPSPNTPTSALASVIKRESSPPQPLLQPSPQPHPLQQPPAAHMQQIRRNHVHALHLVAQNPNGRYHDVQSGPLDMSLSSAPANNSVSVIVPRTSRTADSRHYNSAASAMDGVLDLSNSRSDSEAEPIEEEVDEADLEEEDDECLEDGVDSDSEDESVRVRLAIDACAWQKFRKNVSNDVTRGRGSNGEPYESDNESGNVEPLRLTTT